MIAGCPTCAARYRIDTAKLRPEGARLRCSRCETVFRVQPPVERPIKRAPSAAPVARAAASVPMRPSTPSPAAARPKPAAPDPARLVLIAHPEVASGKAVADAVVRWGFSALLVHDGVEAMLQIQRTLPRIVVLDAALPKMFGFQVCEIMKRNEQLRSIPVVLVGAIHEQDRYRRPPEELYGADAYIERHQLPDALADLLGRFGIQPAQAAPASAPAARPARPAPVAPPAAPPVAAPPQRPAPSTPPAPARPAPAVRPAPAASVSPAARSAVEEGQRLARIIVSDVVLYNAEKFAAGVRAGNVLEVLSAELEEGVSLFAQRVDPKVCDPREYLQRELVRVARSRGMK